MESHSAKHRRTLQTRRQEKTAWTRDWMADFSHFSQLSLSRIDA
jgi:hypothetical protein